MDEVLDQQSQVLWGTDKGAAGSGMPESSAQLPPWRTDAGAAGSGMPDSSAQLHHQPHL